MKEFHKLDSAKKWNYKFLFAEDCRSILTGNLSKKFLVGNSYNEYLLLPEEHRHHYEIINGRQHLYFDIDVPVNESTIPILEDLDHQVDILCEIIHTYLSDIQLHGNTKKVPTRINIYTSHTETKRSYHLIVISHYVLDNILNRYHCEKIKEKYEGPMLQFLDMKVYKTNQLLRLLGSSKLEKNNYKIFWKQYTTGKLNLPDKSLYKLFCHSLVCYLQQGSVLLEFTSVTYDKIPIGTLIYLAHMKRKNVNI